MRFKLTHREVHPSLDAPSQEATHGSHAVAPRAGTSRRIAPTRLAASLMLVWAACGLFGCNTIKGLIGGDKETPTTESEPAPEASAEATAAATEAAPEETAPDTSASAAASAEVAAINAVNEAEIKRFDDEQKLEVPADTKLKDKATNVVKEPPSGDLVAVLQPGTEVKALAERDGFTLLAFDNPTKPGEVLMGWTKTDTVEPVAAAASAEPIPTEACVPGLSKVFVGAAERCELVCADNAGCPTGKTCAGSGKASTDGAPGAPLKFCSAAAAGPTPPKPIKKVPKSEPEAPKKKKKTKGKKDE